MQAKLITIKADFGIPIQLDIHIHKLKVQLERSAANVVKSSHGASARLLKKHVTSVIKCHILHQYAKKRSVHEVHNDLKQEDEEVDYYIGSEEGKPIPPWTTNPQIMRHKINFKIETGADVNIINEDTWVRLEKLRVQPALTSPGGDIETIGKLEIAVHDREVEMFVIKCKSHQSNLLNYRQLLRWAW